MRNHDTANLEQFDPQASAYLSSAVHAAGPDLAAAAALLAAQVPGGSRALDLGCGAGHLSFVLAATLPHVVAADPAPAMRAVVDAAARQRGLASRIETCAASAHAVPFGSGHFDVVATRYSAHHWLDLTRSLAEMHRVLAPAGRLLVIDLLGDESAIVDTHLQAMELLRDPGHVRDRAASQWHDLFMAAGFEVIEEAVFPIRLEFAPWIARMRTPDASAAAIRRMQQDAPREVAEALAFGDVGSFSARTGLFWAQKRALQASGA